MTTRPDRHTSVNGLVAAQMLDGSGHARSVGWKEIRAWEPAQGTLWVHLDRKGAESRRWLLEKSDLEGVVIEELLADASRPSLIPLDEGTLINLRGVNTNPGAEPEDMVWVQMWVEQDRIVSSRHRHVAAVQDIREALSDRGAAGPRDVGDVVIRLAERLLDRMGPLIADLEDVMEQLDTQRAADGRREQRLELVDLRRRTNKLRRWVGPQQEVMLRLATERSQLFNDSQRLQLSHEANRITRYVEDLTDLRDRASDKHDEISQEQSEDMSRTMYVLSVVAAVFLPLALLVELVALDYRGIAGREQSLPFDIVLIGIVALGIGLAAFFWRSRRRFF